MATTSLFPFSPSQKQDAATVAASIVRECIDATATLVAIALAVGSLALLAVILGERVHFLGRPPEGSVHAQLARVLFIVGRSGLYWRGFAGRVCACGGSVAQPPCRSLQAT